MAIIIENEKYYLDTKRRYEAFEHACKYRRVLHGYYDGYPYTQNPEDPNETTGAWRTELLDTTRAAGSPDRAAGIDYISNLPRRKIENIVTAVLPDDTRLTLTVPPGEDGDTPEIPEAARKELYKRLLYFGRTFDTDEPEADLMAWSNSLLSEAAVDGDGLIILVSMAEEEGQPGRMMYRYVPYECWDAETDIHGEPLFYRVEFKYCDVTGEEMWYRRDYYRDHMVIYHDKPVNPATNADLSPTAKQATALDPNTSLYPVDMVVDRVTDENGILKELGDFCCVEVIWELAKMGSIRGKPEITIEDLPAIDSDNELLNSHIAGTIYAGNPPLAIIDGENQTKPGEAGGQSITRKEYQAGAKLNISTSNATEHQAKMTYPDNLPTDFPHADTRNDIKAVLMGCVPDIRPDSEGMKELSDLSGYAYQTILRPFNAKVGRHRRWAVGKILKALRLGLKMLEVQGRVPDGIPAGLDIGLTYGQMMLTEDEMLKEATRLVAYWKLGVPPEVIVQKLRLPPELIMQTLEALNEQKQMENEAAKAEIDKLQEPEPEIPDGTDNKLK